VHLDKFLQLMIKA